MSDDQIFDVDTASTVNTPPVVATPAVEWDHHQKLALRGLLKLWQRFGDLEIWPDTGLRHITQIYPYGVKDSVNFDLAFLMQRGYASFGPRNDNSPQITHSAG